MIIGGFGFIRDYDEIKDARFDYAQLDMPELEQLSENAFSRFQEHVTESSFAVPTGARILPTTEPLFFVPGFKDISLVPYLKSSCKKSAKIGIKKILFGNGKARWLINDDSIKQEKIFINFLRMLCEIAGENGQEVLIEPLGPKYSNYINTLAEAAVVIDKVDMSNSYTMADLRHLVWSRESFENITKYRDIIHHIHIDYPLSFPERKYPDVNDDYDYAPFFNELKGYNGTLTIEADVPDDWNQAGNKAKELLSNYTVKK